jgi:hypothetical protein
LDKVILKQNAYGSKTLKRNASVEAKYSFIPTQEKPVMNLDVIQNLFIPLNFCYGRPDILQLDKSFDSADWPSLTFYRMDSERLMTHDS